MRKVILILTAILIAVIFAMFGFFSRYNYISARTAINKGQYIKVCVNFRIGSLDIEQKIGKKYGIQIIDVRNRLGVKPINYWGILIFNLCMRNAYIEKFGVKTFDRYQHEIDSTRKLQIEM